MKFTRIVSLLTVTLMVILFACSKKEDTPSNNPPVTSGTWMVHLFTDSGNDETSDFAGYDFVFGTDGKLTATKAAVVTNGTWSTRSNDGKQKMTLNLTTSDPVLEQVNKEWDIVSSTATLLQLADDNASSGEVLHFMKK